MDICASVIKGTTTTTTTTTNTATDESSVHFKPIGGCCPLRDEHRASASQNGALLGRNDLLLNCEEWIPLEELIAEVQIEEGNAVNLQLKALQHLFRMRTTTSDPPLLSCIQFVSLLREVSYFSDYAGNRLYAALNLTEPGGINETEFTLGLIAFIPRCKRRRERAPYSTSAFKKLRRQMLFLYHDTNKVGRLSSNDLRAFCRDHLTMKEINKYQNFYGSRSTTPPISPHIVERENFYAHTQSTARYFPPNIFISTNPLDRLEARDYGLVDDDYWNADYACNQPGGHGPAPANRAGTTTTKKATNPLMQFIVDGVKGCSTAMLEPCQKVENTVGCIGKKNDTTFNHEPLSSSLIESHVSELMSSLYCGNWISFDWFAKSIDLGVLPEPQFKTYFSQDFANLTLTFRPIKRTDLMNPIDRSSWVTPQDEPGPAQLSQPTHHEGIEPMLRSPHIVQRIKYRSPLSVTANAPIETEANVIYRRRQERPPGSSELRSENALRLEKFPIFSAKRLAMELKDRIVTRYGTCAKAIKERNNNNNDPTNTATETAAAAANEGNSDLTTQETSRVNLNEYEVEAEPEPEPEREIMSDVSSETDKDQNTSPPPRVQDLPAVDGKDDDDDDNDFNQLSRHEVPETVDTLLPTTEFASLKSTASDEIFVNEGVDGPVLEMEDQPEFPAFELSGYGGALNVALPEVAESSYRSSPSSISYEEGCSSRTRTIHQEQNSLGKKVSSRSPSTPPSSAGGRCFCPRSVRSPLSSSAASAIVGQKLGVPRKEQEPHEMSPSNGWAGKTDPRNARYRKLLRKEHEEQIYEQVKEYFSENVLTVVEGEDADFVVPEYKLVQLLCNTAIWHIVEEHHLVDVGGENSGVSICILSGINREEGWSLRKFVRDTFMSYGPSSWRLLTEDELPFDYLVICDGLLPYMEDGGCLPDEAKSKRILSNVYLLLTLKVLFPKKVFLLRSIPEGWDNVAFRNACEYAYEPAEYESAVSTWNRISDLAEYLPLAWRHLDCGVVLYGPKLNPAIASDLDKLLVLDRPFIICPDSSGGDETTPIRQIMIGDLVRQSLQPSKAQEDKGNEMADRVGAALKLRNTHDTWLVSSNGFLLSTYDSGLLYKCGWTHVMIGLTKEETADRLQRLPAHHCAELEVHEPTDTFGKQLGTFCFYKPSLRIYRNGIPLDVSVLSFEESNGSSVDEGMTGAVSSVKIGTPRLIRSNKQFDHQERWELTHNNPTTKTTFIPIPSSVSSYGVDDGDEVDVDVAF